jgi:RNA polymerase sigma-70 factor (ECF subfamily)
LPFVFTAESIEAGISDSEAIMKMQVPGDVTQLLQDWSQGDQDAFNKLIPLVYDALRQIARKQFQKLGRGGLLQPTVLVHDAYIKLIGQTPVEWKNRTHFYAVAANTIRRILVDDYRRRSADKRGGKQGFAVPISQAEGQTVNQEVDFIALSQALDKLATVDEQQVKIIELRFFAGLNNGEIAQALEISRSQVEREWRSAKAWLYAYLTGSQH